MATISITFDAVKYKTTKTGKCNCGKRLVRSRTFEQTLNPYNKNKDGFPKTRSEINVELQKEAQDWKPEFICNQCLNLSSTPSSLNEKRNENIC